MTKSELVEKIRNVESAAKQLTAAINELVGQNAEGPIGAHAFASQFHLQDCLNRVSNITMFLAQKTDESVEAAVDQATAASNLKIV